MRDLLALLATCCLNGAVDPRTDRLGHRAGSIPGNERILTLLAIGYAAEDCVVPLSPRRPVDDALVWH